MQYGICLLSVVPARKEPSGTSEMVTQLLFGDRYTVVETKEDWLSIKTAFDHYACWISIKQHSRLSHEAFHALQKESPVFSAEPVQLIHNHHNKQHFLITIGAALPAYQNGTCSFDQYHFTFEGQTSGLSNKKPVHDLLDTAKLFLEAPYQWGGKSLFGIDCSGFTQTVYKLNGYTLPRDAKQQVELGHPLSFVEEAEAGDLAFFDNEEGTIVHVGILLSNHEIIHASGCVRIDKFDHYGIFNVDTKKYSHTLRVIKRVMT